MLFDVSGDSSHAGWGRQPGAQPTGCLGGVEGWVEGGGWSHHLLLQLLCDTDRNRKQEGACFLPPYLSVVSSDRIPEKQSGLEDSFCLQF